MWAHYLNVQGSFFSEKHPEVQKLTRQFFDKQDAWTRSMIKQNRNDPFWINVEYVLSQFDGMVAGYQATADREWVRFVGGLKIASIVLAFRLRCH